MPDPSADPQMDNTDNSTIDSGGSRSILGLHRSDQVFVAVMLAALVILSVVYWTKLSGWGQKPVEIKRLPVREYDFRLDVNSATWVQWAQLEGIGEVLARRIVADRNQQGPFATVDDIRRVNGIGAKKLDAIREWLYVTPAADDE